MNMNNRDSSDPRPEGRVQVYTGNGKGKTTAALGLAVRAACSGCRVFIGQFMKGGDYGELRLPEHFPGLITMEQFGTPRLICRGETPGDEDLEKAAMGVSRMISAVSGDEYRLVIADELNVTVHLGLLTPADAMRIVHARAAGVELVITGRYAPREILDAADLITEMNEVRHYYAVEGLAARKGIEF